MNILYLITKWLTIPGAFVRAIIEHIVCKICGIPVEDNRIIRNDELFGHVEHEFAPTARKAFSLCFVPAFVNACLALPLFFVSIILLFSLQVTSPLYLILSIACFWVGLSLNCNSYPLVEDMMNMKEKVYGGKNVWLKIVYAPGFAFLFVLTYCEKYCITFLFAIAGLIALLCTM